MLKIGIFFGGPSREREVSFAGGRTVFDNLNKAVFEPVPIFVDSFGQLIEIDWEYIYKGTIRDFYPPSDYYSNTETFQLYIESIVDTNSESLESIARQIGIIRTYDELPQLIDIAFLALHGEFGEDGQIQGMLETLDIPYTGSGIRACAIGIDKVFQKKLMQKAGFLVPPTIHLKRSDWFSKQKKDVFRDVVKKIGSKYVIRPAHQGSSIGVFIGHTSQGENRFNKAVDAAFFVKKIQAKEWTTLNDDERVHFLSQLTDLRNGLGFPVRLHKNWIKSPEELAKGLDTYFASGEKEMTLEAFWSEQDVLVESFIDGKEFSCIVIQDERGIPVALPPTEIIKKEDLFDYRSKYLPGLSRKRTPIEIPKDQINAIRNECEKLFDFLDFDTYARIDGFITDEGIYLNDPNTTSGMLPSSFFFHQAAEIGLNPSQFLSYVIWASLVARSNKGSRVEPYLPIQNELNHRLQKLNEDVGDRTKVGVILGGYSYERHISVESGRNIYEKLSSSSKYEPIPLFLSKKSGKLQLHQLPINILLKDNADDIFEKIKEEETPEVSKEIKARCKYITKKFSSETTVFKPKAISWPKLTDLVDSVFIALHGRPGEDGSLQRILDKYNIPYNGSEATSASITIDKFQTLEILRNHGFHTAVQKVILKEQYHKSPENTIDHIVTTFSLPCVAKPVDDGCSSAVRVIRSKDQLTLYLESIFRTDKELSEKNREKLHLSPSEEFPLKNRVLIESLITKNEANKIIEITGGLLTHYQGDRLKYEIFEPSEALASGEVLTLEEKFLAGEGQNITPARFSKDPQTNQLIANKVKTDLEQVARILDIKGYARIDAFVRIYDDQEVETIIIEVNSLPGMTPATCIFHQAALANYTPFEFIDQIIQFSFDEFKRKQMAQKA